MALGVHEEALLARQRALHRPVEQPRGQRCVRLVAHVLLATERAAVGHERDGDRVIADGEHASDVVAVVPHALAARVHLQVPRPVDETRHGERALRFEERVLDALRLERLMHGVRSCGEPTIDVAARVLADRQHVVLRAPHGDRRARLHGRYRIGDRLVHLVSDFDERRGVACLLARLGDDDGHHVTGVAGATADGDHHRPVLLDDADVELAGDVGGGEDRDDAIGRGRGGWVDAEHVGTGVRGEVQRSVQRAGHAHVVDVAAIAERQLRSLVLRATASDGRRERGRELLALGDGVDRVEHLHVTGAAAEVSAEVSSHVGTFEVGTLLVDLRLGAHDDAGDAEPALQPTARSEGVGEGLALRRGHALEGDDRLAGHLRQRLLAADHGLAVDVHRAAPALPRGRAAVLR